MEVKFSIPPYVSLLARSVATLEGVALQGDKEYQIVAWPGGRLTRCFGFIVEALVLPESLRMAFQG